MISVGTSLDVVLPVLNEERALPEAVATLRDFMSSRLSAYRWRIVVSDNGSKNSPKRKSTVVPGMTAARFCAATANAVDEASVAITLVNGPSTARLSATQPLPVPISATIP